MLDGHVLVLNRVFQAVQITSVRRALTLLYKGQVRAVDSEYRTYDFENWMDIPVQPEDHFVVTPSRNILIPHVVQLLGLELHNLEQLPLGGPEVSKLHQGSAAQIQQIETFDVAVVTDHAGLPLLASIAIRRPSSAPT